MIMIHTRVVVHDHDTGTRVSETPNLVGPYLGNVPSDRSIIQRDWIISVILKIRLQRVKHEIIAYFTDIVPPGQHLQNPPVPFD